MAKRTRNHGPALACAAALALGAATPALASRTPTAKERQAIVAAIKRADETAAVRGRFVVRTIAIATVGAPPTRYARADIAPKPGVTGDGAVVALRRTAGTWKVVDLGTGGAGCRLPRRVRRDLKIVGCG